MKKEATKKSRVANKSETTGWESWSLGQGWSLKLADGLKCSVAKSMVRNEGFVWEVFGLRGKSPLEDANEAKRVAERVARRLLKEAIANLPNDKVSLDGSGKDSK